MASSEGYEGYEFLLVEWVSEAVLSVKLNRPAKSNAMNSTFWREMLVLFQKIKHDTNVRAVVITAAGKNFTAGLDLMDMADPGVDTEDVGRKAYFLHDHVLALQESFNAIEVQLQCA